MKSKETISRRSLLKGATLTAVSPFLLPLYRRLEAEAKGDAAKLPKRFLFVVKSSGLTPAELVPPKLKSNWVRSPHEEGWPEELERSKSLQDLSLKELKLPRSLEALESFKDQLTILQGLSGKMCRGGHSAWYGALGCYHTGNEGSPGRAASPTIDGVLAKHLPAIFPHVGLTLGGKVLSGVKDSVVYPGISAIAPDRPLAYQANPRMAYNSLFGIAQSGKKAKSEQELRSMLLDHLVGDIKKLQKEIANQDREKLDQYLEAFEGLRDRRRKLEGLEAQIRTHAPVVSDKFKSEVETDRLEAHFDIAAGALIAGLTNVVTVRADTLDVTYRGLGISKHVHGIGHAESVAGMTPVEARNRIRQFHIEQIGRVAQKLSAIPEGDGTFLDNTLIIYLSDAAEKHHGSCEEWPFLLLGGLGRSWKAKNGGRYLQYPGYGHRGQRTIANFYNSLLYLAGKPQEQFGRLDISINSSVQKGPLPELMI